MKPEYDFSKGRRGPALSTRGKTRITIYLDDAIVSHFKSVSESTGKGYQTLINEALSQKAGHIGPMASIQVPAVTADQVRAIVREELRVHERSSNGLRPHDG